MRTAAATAKSKPKPKSSTSSSSPSSRASSTSSGTSRVSTKPKSSTPPSSSSSIASSSSSPSSAGRSSDSKVSAARKRRERAKKSMETNAIPGTSKAAIAAGANPAAVQWTPPAARAGIHALPSHAWQSQMETAVRQHLTIAAATTMTTATVNPSKRVMVGGSGSGSTKEIHTGVLPRVLVDVVLSYIIQSQMMLCIGHAATGTPGSILTITVTPQASKTPYDQEFPVLPTTTSPPTTNLDAIDGIDRVVCREWSCWPVSSDGKTMRSSIYDEIPSSYLYTSAGTGGDYIIQNTPLRYLPQAAVFRHLPAVLYVAGGWNLSVPTAVPLATVTRYSLVDGSEHACASMSQTRRGAPTSIIHNQWIFVGGGGSGTYDDPDRTVEWYNCDQDKWYLDMPNTTDGHAVGAALSIDHNRMMVFGGLTSPLVESYDPRAGLTSWLAHRPMPARVYGHTAIMMNDDTVMVFGGNTADGHRQSGVIQSYDIRNDQWRIEYAPDTDAITMTDSKTAGVKRDAEFIVKPVTHSPWPSFPANTGFVYSSATVIDDQLIIVGGQAKPLIYAIRLVAHEGAIIPAPGHTWRTVTSPLKYGPNSRSGMAMVMI